MEATGFAPAVRAWLTEARRDRDGRPAQAPRRHLELVPLRNGGLMDVAGEDQLGTGVDERRKYVRAAGNRLLPRAPGRADQMVVEDDDAQRAVRCGGEQLGSPLQLR